VADTENTKAEAEEKEYDDDLTAEPRFPGGGGWGRTSDYADPHRSWTVQSPRPMPDGAWNIPPTTKFHPSELPNPDVIKDAGLKQLAHRADLVDEDAETLPPSGNYAVDHPSRKVHRRKVSEAGGLGDQDEAEYKKAKKLTTVTVEDAPVEEKSPVNEDM
jgi:hypothetical protein